MDPFNLALFRKVNVLHIDSFPPEDQKIKDKVKHIEATNPSSLQILPAPGGKGWLSAEQMAALHAVSNWQDPAIKLVRHLRCEMRPGVELGQAHFERYEGSPGLTFEECCYICWRHATCTLFYHRQHNNEETMATECFLKSTIVANATEYPRYHLPAAAGVPVPLHL